MLLTLRHDEIINSGVSKIQSEPVDMVIVRRNSILEVMRSLLRCQDCKIAWRSKFKEKGVESTP